MVDACRYCGVREHFENRLLLDFNAAGRTLHALATAPGAYGVLFCCSTFRTRLFGTNLLTSAPTQRVTVHHTRPRRWSRETPSYSGLPARTALSGTVRALSLSMYVQKTVFLSVYLLCLFLSFFYPSLYCCVSFSLLPRIVYLSGYCSLLSLSYWSVSCRLPRDVVEYNTSRTNDR